MKRFLFISALALSGLFLILYAIYLVDTDQVSIPVISPHVDAPVTVDERIPTVAEIVEFIRKRALESGVDPVIADWIVRKESSYCFHNGFYEPDVAGDDGISIGCWQFNIAVHNNPATADYISRECAIDFFGCATDKAMKWLKAGKQNAWSAWRLRHTLYKTAPY